MLVICDIHWNMKSPPPQSLPPWATETAGNWCLQASLSARPFPEPCRSFMQEVIRAWGATLVSGLFLHTGQKFILSGSYMASSLGHLHICRPGKMLPEVTPVSPSPISTLFSFWHLLDPSWRNCISAMSDSALHCLIANKLQLLTPGHHVLLKRGVGETELNFCLSLPQCLGGWSENYATYLVYSPEHSKQQKL